MQATEKEKRKRGPGIWETAEKRHLGERRSVFQKERTTVQEKQSFFRTAVLQKERERQAERLERVFWRPSAGKTAGEHHPKTLFFGENGVQIRNETKGERRFGKEISRRELFSRQKEEKDRQRSVGNLFFADMRRENKERTALEEMSRYFSEIREKDSGQNVTIHIGQIRETADVDKVMEEMTKKLWEARSMGRSRIERRR
ncbi:hypothetical protein H9X83_02830 [Anaerotignum lactatifermentans]|uniref:Uncharacterized protein n=2 Tax=Anaerotignum lactatifermentans TaxID=160404 RepID=A0ABS2G7T9_9FIRM|nr:hypothetical protein [Anaerotignum lactatifermentans]